MSNPRNYRRLVESKAISKAICEKEDEGWEFAKASGLATRPVDYELIDRLLALPDATEEDGWKIGLSEGQRRHLKASREWLDKNPNRCLARFIRQRYESWEYGIKTAAKAKASGAEPKPVSERRPKRPFVLAKRKELPAWMNDPSLLPKRPPGRVG